MPMNAAHQDGKKRKQRDAEATREAILQVATEEYARVGLHGARVEEIASRTATSKHMIYYYFGSKEACIAPYWKKPMPISAAPRRRRLRLDGSGRCAGTADCHFF
jgi:AcrR family transcriptional regulator